MFFFFFFQAEDGIRDLTVTGVQTCALPIFPERSSSCAATCRFRNAPTVEDVRASIGAVIDAFPVGVTRQTDTKVAPPLVQVCRPAGCSIHAGQSACTAAASNIAPSVRDDAASWKYSNVAVSMRNRPSASAAFKS